jgi:hypothetical protein
LVKRSLFPLFNVFIVSILRNQNSLLCIGHNNKNQYFASASINLLTRGWFVEQRLMLSSSFKRDQIYKYEIYYLGHTLLCNLSPTQIFNHRLRKVDCSSFVLCLLQVLSLPRAFLRQPLTVLTRQTKHAAVHAIYLTVFLRCLCVQQTHLTTKAKFHFQFQLGWFSIINILIIIKYIIM